MHKWFKERFYVWELDGCRWYSNGHVLISQPLMDTLARAGGAFCNLRKDLIHLPIGAYNNGEREGDADPSMVRTVLSEVGDIRPVEDTKWVVASVSSIKRHGYDRVFRIPGTDKVVCLESGYAELYDAVEAAAVVMPANGDDVCGPVGLWLEHFGHAGLIMPRSHDVGSIKVKGDAVILE